VQNSLLSPEVVYYAQQRSGKPVGRLSQAKTQIGISQPKELPYGDSGDSGDDRDFRNF
jgi:hypothetical protein